MCKVRKTGDVIRKNTTPKPNYIDNLPTEVLLRIFGYLGEKDRVAALKTCQKWHDIIKTSPQLWRFKVFVLSGVKGVKKKTKMLQFLEAYGAYIRVLDIVIPNAFRCIYPYMLPLTQLPKLKFEFIEYFRRQVKICNFLFEKMSTINNNLESINCKGLKHVLDMSIPDLMFAVDSYVLLPFCQMVKIQKHLKHFELSNVELSGVRGNRVMKALAVNKNLRSFNISPTGDLLIRSLPSISTLINNHVT